jgi:hypothetical protein
LRGVGESCINQAITALIECCCTLIGSIPAQDAVGEEERGVDIVVIWFWRNDHENVAEVASNRLVPAHQHTVHQVVSGRKTAVVACFSRVALEKSLRRWAVECGVLPLHLLSIYLFHLSTLHLRARPAKGEAKQDRRRCGDIADSSGGQPLAQTESRLRSCDCDRVSISIGRGYCQNWWSCCRRRWRCHGSESLLLSRGRTRSATSQRTSCRHGAGHRS